jgi:ornithine cyclodeaminase/alanine dehydrogenase-like protein (mu-crystallin family)
LGRTCDDDITSFKARGMVAEDLVVADFILKQAHERDMGQMINW